MAAQFVWYDVTAAPIAASGVREFYGQLFGWQIESEDRPGPYEGVMLDGGEPWAAVVEAGDPTAGAWIPFVRVDDLDAATARARELGADVMVEATNGPAGIATTIKDPGGALLALWVPYPDAPAPA